MLLTDASRGAGTSPFQVPWLLLPIGELSRPGPLVAGSSAPGCIGSSNGGECFQGAMDDLRIYSAALTPDGPLVTGLWVDTGEPRP